MDSAAAIGQKENAGAIGSLGESFAAAKPSFTYNRFGAG
jgi:hypothetical protein